MLIYESQAHFRPLVQHSLTIPVGLADERGNGNISCALIINSEQELVAYHLDSTS
jgi:hypothetical protein